MKRVIFLGITLLLVASSGLAGCAAPAPTYKPEYKLSLVVSQTTGWGMGAQKFADIVKEKTGGKVNIKCYFGGQLFAGKQTNEFAILREGAADFAFGSTINWSPQVKELNLFTLPFFFNSYAEVEAVEKGEAGKKLLQKLDELGVVGLAWGENGFRELTNAKREIRKPEDLKDLKIRVVGSKIFVDTFTALGANPTTMSWAEAVTAFQQGVVDGQENPIVGVIIPYKVYEWHKYMTVWHYAIDPLIVGVNKATWQSFDANTQKIIKDAAEESVRYQIALVRAGLDDGTAIKYLNSLGVKPEITDPYAFLKEKGVTITVLSEEELKAFREKTKPVFDQWVKEIGEDLVKLAEADKAKVKTK